MANQTTVSTALPEPTKKRQRDEDSEELPKTKKIENNPESLSTHITALNTNCFKHLLNYLNLNDLFVLCDLNADAMDAAIAVFAERYSEYLVQICGNCIPNSKPEPIVLEEPELDDFKLEINMDTDEAESNKTVSKIIISSASDSATFLRIFGKSIKKLELQSLTNDKLKTDWLEVKTLFQTKCVAGLTEFKINNCGTDMFDGLENVFGAVKSLEIICSRLGKCADLSKWFPNVNQLELKLMHGYECYKTDRSLIGPRKICLPMSDVYAMINSAPQVLHTLKTHGKINMNFLRLINKKLPMLKRLDLDLYDFDDDAMGKVLFKNLEVLSVSKELPYEVPIKCEKLTELKVDADYLYQDWLDFAAENEHLTKLSIDATYHKYAVISDNTLSNFAMKLMKLTELKITAYHVKRKGLASFLSKCKTLKKFTIEYNYDELDYNPLFEKPRSKWRVIGDCPLVLKHKNV